jgi:hypothetical protein
MKGKIKNVIFIVIIVAAVFVVYSVFFKKEAAPALQSTTGATAPTPQGQELGQEFLSTLLGLRTIKLDDSIFTSPSFNFLRDFTTVLIPEGNEGRPNPFAPIGVEFGAPPTEETL